MMIFSAGTISQRVGYFELQSDQGFMIPPFPPCGHLSPPTGHSLADPFSDLGLVTSNDSLLDFGLTQWTLDASGLYDSSVQLFRHINDYDPNFWATGNGWILYGGMRIVSAISGMQSARLIACADDQLASIEAAGQTDEYSKTISTVQTQMSQVFSSIFDKINVGFHLALTMRELMSDRTRDWYRITCSRQTPHSVSVLPSPFYWT